MHIRPLSELRVNEQGPRGESSARSDDISSMERGPLPATFTSVYRLFLRASSAAVLHHKVATRHLRLLWRPTFREAARVIRSLQDPALGTDDRARCERWLARWDTTVDNTLALLYSSARSRGLAHRLTRNLSFTAHDFRGWHDRRLNKPAPAWNPHADKFAARKGAPAPAAQTALATARAAARDRRRDEAARGGVEWSALAEVVRMAEGSAGISLGRLEFLRRRA